MHKIYEDEGDFNFIYQIPQILYSTIISSVINIIITFSSLSQRSLLLIKNGISKNQLKVINYLTVKFIIFFVLFFSLLISFWYYVACFCVVYPNTQIYLVKDTLISFVISIIYPFFLYLIPGIFRIFSLQTHSQENMYNFSKILQLL